jgi:hypothetical protein
MTGRTQTLPWWLGGEGVETTENKIARCLLLYIEDSRIKGLMSFWRLEGSRTRWDVSEEVDTKKKFNTVYRIWKIRGSENKRTKLEDETTRSKSFDNPEDYRTSELEFYKRSRTSED